MPSENKKKAIKVKISKTKRIFKKSKEKSPYYDINFKPGEQEESIISATPVKEKRKVAKPAKEQAVNRNFGDKLHLNLYRKIAASFILLTILLVAIIIYFSIVKVTITVLPKKEKINSNLVVDIYKDEKDIVGKNYAIAGNFGQIALGAEGTYSASGEEPVGEETTGKVTIVNNYTKNQPLVATTRLLSPDNKLFRIKDTVSVPAGGSVEVEVYADAPGPETAIGPAKFVLPGLWAGLQDKIYAESRENMEYNRKVKKIISQTDIDSAVSDLKNKLIAQAGKEVNEKYKDFPQVIYKIDEDSVSVDSDGKAGDEKGEFNVIVKGNIFVVAFSDDQIEKMVRGKISSIIATGKEIVDFDKNKITYNLSNLNMEQGNASANAGFEVEIALKKGSDIIDREKLVGLTKDQLKDFLDKDPNISSYEVKFSPSFIKKVPKLTDRIKIEVK